MLTKAGAKLMDFGLAKPNALAGGPKSGAPIISSDGHHQLPCLELLGTHVLNGPDKSADNGDGGGHVIARRRHILKARLSTPASPASRSRQMKSMTRTRGKPRPFRVGKDSVDVNC